MKEFLSKFTFGFVMAQLFPGVLLVVSITFALQAALGPRVSSVNELCVSACALWLGSLRGGVAFLVVSIAAGMLIHGINWMVLAWLENHSEQHETYATISFGHKHRLWLQILFSPFKMLGELVWMIAAAHPLERLCMEENVPFIKPQYMSNFNFLQDMYLHFSQFYLHSAYALLFSLPAFILTWCYLGFTLLRAALLVAIYFGASVFFIIGRVQTGSLWTAEGQIRLR